MKGSIFWEKNLKNYFFLQLQWSDEGEIITGTLGFDLLFKDYLVGLEGDFTFVLQGDFYGVILIYVVGWLKNWKIQIYL